MIFVSLSYFLGRPTETLDEDYEGINRHMRTAELPFFSLAEISKATNDFSINNKLGQGGFGPVYKVNGINQMFIFVHYKHDELHEVVLQRSFDWLREKKTS
ncbi:putative non-specific serine/threonine protein kinase [Helianthus anomalus]